MTAPGGAGTLRKAPFPRARTTGFSHKVGALALLGSDPSLATGPMLQGVSYVHHEYASLYIRNIIPTGGAYPVGGPGRSGCGYAGCHAARELRLYGVLRSSRITPPRNVCRNAQK